MNVASVLAWRAARRQSSRMPLARIDLPRGKTPEYRRTIGDVVYEAMIRTINVPANDRFQVIDIVEEDAVQVVHVRVDVARHRNVDKKERLAASFP